MSLIRALIFVCVAVNLVHSIPVIPYSYPLYKQCDPAWGNNTIITTTVCEVGCLMSSVSMSLAGKGIQVDGQLATPGTLNAWLKTNQGYTSNDELEEGVVAELPAVQWVGPSIPGTSLSMEDIAELLNQRVTVILNVLNGGHFVLCVGYDSDAQTLYVNDPGFQTIYYNYSDVVGYRIFKMNL
ncbi:hypothetical protein PPL_01623 [Heterostelium album PN500]|uniref:Peptidase C39-like domain-containing protein n=1 Tax=Heterostelium pallidum (strain ATCC 26659 / Pp 5 / PN500) TaxID=670386 RepID=D3B009_HETP5|nr:hypothetical protein PPL_01623 [Heterostelium album PN500]EFA84633.1 hypothetical protein PPL_01623 [Heterostelium album PN500]|eukprot:XP_020436746.1 hypothetical protein PPL_01623 [Heterostelium album PN500]